MNNLIACQPSAIKAVRLQCLVPPHPEKITIRDLLGKDEVYHITICTFDQQIKACLHNIQLIFPSRLLFWYMFVRSTILVHNLLVSFAECGLCSV